MVIVASAPAKTILLGEHFVVYGEPAIVLAIDKRVYATVNYRSDKDLHLQSTNLDFAGFFSDGHFKIKHGNAVEARLKFEPVKLAVERIFESYGEIVGLDVDINSAVPVAAGLGSSGAVISAVTTAVSTLLGVKLSREAVFRITYEAEKIVHGTPSGVDSAIATFGGAILFQTDTGVKPLEVKMGVPLVVGYTGVERSTRAQIEKVRRMMNAYPRIGEPFKRAAREIVLRAIDAFGENDLSTLGELMNINHALLCGVGVSDESLERLISAARKAGAFGAKLTGPGGGGCMIALTSEEKLERIMEAITMASGKPFITRKTDEGVRIEQT